MIDDDPDVQLSARMALEKAGYKVVEARSGKDGLERIRSEKPGPDHPGRHDGHLDRGSAAGAAPAQPDPTSELAEFRHIQILMLTAIHGATARFEPDIDYLPVELFVDEPMTRTT